MFEVGAAAGHHGGDQSNVQARLHRHDGFMLTSVSPQLHTTVTQDGLSEVRIGCHDSWNTSLNALENRRRYCVRQTSLVPPTMPAALVTGRRKEELIGRESSLTWKDGPGEQESHGVLPTSSAPRRSPLHLPSGRGTRRRVHRRVETNTPFRPQQGAIRCPGLAGVA